MPNQLTGLVTEASVRVHIPGDAFNYKGNVTVEARLAYDQPTAWEVVADDVDTIGHHLRDEALAQHEAALQAIAQRAGIEVTRMGFSQVTPVPAAAPAQAPAGYQAAPAPAAPVMQQGGSIVSVQGRYGALHIPHPQAVPTQALNEQVLGAMSGPEFEVHPSQVRFFDNRQDLIAGTDRSGHLGVVRVSRNGSQAAQAAIGGKAIAWVDWDLQGGVLKVRPTKDFGALPLSVRTELASPATGGSPF